MRAVLSSLILRRALWGVLLLVTSGNSEYLAGKSDPPNILIIVADDLGTQITNV